MSDPLIDIIGPEYREALAREAEIRDEAYIDAPEFILGVEVLPFTLAHYALLSAMRSPFLTGRVPSATDIALFLWVVSPQYRAVMSISRVASPFSSRLARAMVWTARYLFVRRTRKLRYSEAVKAINKYVDDAMMDCPRGGEESTEPKYWSSIASNVAILAHKLHWGEQAILTLPAKKAFQYVKIATKLANPATILFNPSDRFVGQWLKKVNSERN